LLSNVFLFREHLMLSNQLTEASWHPSSNAHTYRLFIVKERCSVLLAALGESFCSSAAEKRDYAVSLVCRQHSFFASLQFPTGRGWLNHLMMRFHGMN
jgi:hypothetical protein